MFNCKRNETLTLMLTVNMFAQRLIHENLKTEVRASQISSTRDDTSGARVKACHKLQINVYSTKNTYNIFYLYKFML